AAAQNFLALSPALPGGGRFGLLTLPFSGGKEGGWIHLGDDIMATGAQSLPWAGPSRLNLNPRAWLIVIGPLLVGLLVALPLVILLVSSFNTAAPGREATYGIENW